MREDRGLSIPLAKQESREMWQMLEWSWDGSQTKGGDCGCSVQKMEREPIHIYRVTDNTQIGQMSKDTRRTQFREVIETLMKERKFLEREVQDG